MFEKWRQEREKRKLEAEKSRIEQDLSGARKQAQLLARVKQLRAEAEDFQREADQRANEPTEISVVSPTAGTTWTRGQAAQIRWDYTGLLEEPLRIDLLKRGYFFREIQSRASLIAKEHSFVVPQELLPAADYTIRIIGRDSGIMAIGEQFAIT